MSKVKIVILGGGFGGVFTAKFLRKYASDALDIELINETNYFVFQPLLPEVAAGIINAADAVTPLRLLLRGVKIRMAVVRSIDLGNKTLQIVQGSKRRVIDVPYDHLVLASGQVVDLSRIPGMPEHAFTMKNLADAHRLRNHVINCLEHADVTRYPDLKKRLLTFVVVGAGFSGVETVGEMEDMIRRTLKFYPNIQRDEIKLILIEYASRILPELPVELADYAAEKMRKRGIEIRLNTATQSAQEGVVQTSDGAVIETMTVVATIGNGPSPLVLNLPVKKERGKIIADRYMRVPDFENVWALGDCALIPLNEGAKDAVRYAPPTAQFALREARTLAKNIIARVHDQLLTPFEYQPKGMLASLGAYRAVAQIEGIKLSGVFAWMLWRGFYLALLPGMATKIRVAMNWLLDYFVPRNTVQIQQSKVESSRYICYRAGDIVFEPGMIADGFYTVISGAFELVIDDGDPNKRIVKRIGPGEHFGERVIFGEGLRTGLVRVLEDSYVFFINREDLVRFTRAFRVLDDYFKDYIAKTFPQAQAPDVSAPEVMK